MTKTEIDNFRNKIARYIDSRRLRDAIAALKDMAHRRMAWEISELVEQTEKNYAYMLGYLAQGANDPERHIIYDTIIYQLYAELDALVFFMQRSDNASQYFSTVRLYDRSPRSGRIDAMINSTLQAADKVSIFSILSDTSDAPREQEDRSRLENLRSDLFATIWTIPALSTGDQDAIASLLASDEAPNSLKTQVISAITLGLMQIYDARRIALLMDAYMIAPDITVSSAALVGMLIGLWLYGKRPLMKSLADRMAAVKEMPSWHADLRIAFIEMIRARDTERLNRKIRDEIVPDMMKLKPEIMDKMNQQDLESIDLAAMQENPEWQELLDRNGITDKLKELTEAQMEGGDVMMSTFSHLKGFPFFNDIANWFLPFDSAHTQVCKSAEKAGVVADMIENARFLCDSDKYSFMFALDMVPPQQREMMTSQFKAQSDGIYDAMNNANSTGSDARKQAVNSYIQNIYRFFKLYRRKDEFFDPFDQGINLTAVKALAEDFDDEQLLQMVAEFYFKLGYYDDALDVFDRLESIMPGDAQRYQKMGYCEEKLGKYEQAIDYYQRAELLDAQSAWVTRRLATCYRALGNRDKAIEYYKLLTEYQPDSLSAAMLYGYMLLEDKDYKEALHQFYRMEFIDENSDKPWRPLAWTLFLTGDFKGAAKYYEKIAADKPTANDYLNMGHLALATGNMKDAINNYSLSLQSNPDGQESFIYAINADIPDLVRLGIPADEIPLIIDAVLYK